MPCCASIHQSRFKIAPDEQAEAVRSDDIDRYAGTNGSPSLPNKQHYSCNRDRLATGAQLRSVAAERREQRVCRSASGGRGVGGDVSSTGRGVYVPFCAGLPNLQISTTFRSVSFALPS